jgi:hypothetical protein
MRAYYIHAQRENRNPDFDATSRVSAWLAVASAEHVRRGVALGIAQAGHGRRGGLARMRAGDTIVYYSPTERLGDGMPLKQFTAIGRIADDEIWQADEGDFRPFRRRIDWLDAAPVEVEAVRDRLILTAQRNWGYQLRRGLIPLADGDAETLLDAMQSVDTQTAP